MDKFDECKIGEIVLKVTTKETNIKVKQMRKLMSVKLKY